MSTSGTVAQTVFNTQKMIEHAARRAGFTSGAISLEVQQVGRECLYLFLSHMANQGINLWCVEKWMQGFYEGKNTYATPKGTIGILNLNQRTLQRITGGTATSSAGGTASYAFDSDLTTACTQTSTNGNLIYDATTATAAGTQGIMMNVSRVFDLVISASTDGTTYTTIKSLGQRQFTAGEWYWFDLDNSTSYRYWKLAETGGNTMDITEWYLGNTPADVPVARLNRDDYDNLANKAFQASTVTQYYFDRTREYPRAIVYPTPSSGAAFKLLWGHIHRQIQDVGSLTEEVEVPQRWLLAITTKLAFELACNYPALVKGPLNIQQLDQIATRNINEAQQEERDPSPIYLAPNISVYTQ